MSSLQEWVERRIAAGGLELPVFPSSAQEVLALCEEEDVDAKKLAEVIRRDASLAGHFLALANSAAFGARTQLVTLQQALTRLGTAQTKQIAMVIACKTRAFVVPGRPERAAELLAHAFATALYAQEIARARRLNVEEGFLGGLLHDIGVPAVLQACADAPDGHAPEEIDACAEHFHQQIGGLIATSWAMRGPIVEAITNHHTTPGKPVVAIVQLADALAHGERDLSKHPAADVLNLYPEDIERVVTRVAALAESEKEAA